jgi:dTDP-4-dehydrorhamnose reductase
MTKVLVFGRIGQLGNALQNVPWPNDWQATAYDVPEVDFTRTDGLKDLIRRERPAVIINAAAYTAVDKAESETTLSWQINALAPAAIAEIARDTGAALVHVSTDYVYNGDKEGPWVETDPIGPLGTYGASKAAGDIAVQCLLERYLILRTSWVYAAHGNNFVKTMLRLGRERDRLTVVDDQWGRPTEVTDLARGALLAAEHAVAKDADWGTYHFSNSGEPTTFARFAREIFARAEPWYGKGPEVAAIPTTEYPTPARRPSNSLLSLAKWQAAFGQEPRAWPDALSDVLAALKNQ